MFLMSNSTKICIVFNKYKSKIVQLNFKIKVVSLPGNRFLSFSIFLFVTH